MSCSGSNKKSSVADYSDDNIDDYDGEFDINDNITDNDYGDCGDNDDLTPIDEIIQTNVSKNIRDLRTFFEVNKFQTEKNDQRTNLINVAERRTYCIPDTHIEAFFTSLEMCRRENRMIHYSERQETAERQRSGIMWDFDCYQKDKTPQLNNTHFVSIARKLANSIIACVDIPAFMGNDPNDFKFNAFFIRKPEILLSPDKDGTVRHKDGFHMLVPELMISKGLKKHIINEIVNTNGLASIFKSVHFMTGPTETLDVNSSSVPVQFVGNTRPGKPAYNLVYACEVRVLSDDNYAHTNIEAIDVTPLNRGEAIVDGKTIPINLSYELSLYYKLDNIGGKPTWLRKRELNYKLELETKIQHQVEKTSRGILDEGMLAENENSVDLLALNNAEAAYLKQLLILLDNSYTTEYKKWFCVIMAIANTGIQYKPLAEWFSHRRPEAFSKGEFERVWNEAMTSKYTGRPLTKRSIREWARLSAPAAFDKVDKESYANVLAREAYSNEGRIEHAGAAKVVYAMTAHKFVVDCAESNGRPQYQWFEFVTQGQAMRPGEVFKWRQECDPDNIHLFVGEHLPKVYQQLIASMKDRKEQAADENTTKYWNSVIKNFKTSSSRLGNDGYQRGVINQCKYRFRQRGFLAELDSYKDIIGVGNGVLKIGPTPELIRGFHEYKISKYTETNYKPYDPANPFVQTLLQAFRDIWIEPDVFEFIMCHAATGLDCNESANIFFMGVGGGRNGKSFTSRMIHETLGDMYCASGKSTLLVGAFEKGGEANSAQMQQKGKRYFYVDEFEQNSVLNTTRMKSCVSPNKQSGRDLYDKQGNFKNTCNTIAFSNFDFIVDTNDHGTWRRIYYYRNKVKFCDTPNPNNPFEKRVDRRFSDVYPHDPNYREAMLSIMVHYYGILCTKYGGDLNNIPVPTINYETELFRNRQDSLNRFITSMMVRSPETKEPLKMSAISGKYSDWYNVHIKKYTGKQAPADVSALFDNSCLADMLKTIDGNNKYLDGYRILGSEDEALGPGEERIGNAIGPQKPWLTPEILAEETAAVVAARDNNNVDDINWENNISNLTKNAPTHIQSIDANTSTDLAIMEAYMDVVAEYVHVETTVDTDGNAVVEI